MGYSILVDNDMLKGDFLRSALFDAQALSYRKIIQKKWRDTFLPVGEDTTVYNPDNDFFYALKEKFDDYSSEAVEEVLNSGSKLAQAVNSVAKTKRKSLKHAKKQSTRVMKEVTRMWKQGCYGEKDKDVWRALNIFHRAFRESFITLRCTLKTDVYQCIPKKLEIMLQNGEKEEICSLYTFDEELGKYRFRDNIHLSATDLRNLQLILAPYIFEKIHAGLIIR